MADRKMYILVRDNVSVGLAMAAVGHAVLACYLKFKDDPVMHDWAHQHPFRKVVCKVDERQFRQAAALELPHIIMTEMALDGAETALAFLPVSDDELPKVLRYCSLYRVHCPNCNIVCGPVLPSRRSLP